MVSASTHMLSTLRTLVWLLFLSFVVSPIPAAAKPQRPLVFIPGILGSVLSDSQGVVWGDRYSFANFAKLELPIDQSAPRTQLHAQGLVQNVQVLGPWKVHQYDGLMKTLSEIGYVEGRDLFVFPYDWRRSNFDTARDLDAFIKNTKSLDGKEFDLLCHSMGGLVGQIYITRFDRGRSVRQFVTMGTPYQGSAQAFFQMENGWGALESFMAGGIETIRRVVFSFPSLYELLPSYDNCCIAGGPESPQRTPFSAFDLDYWSQFKWVPRNRDAIAQKRFLSGVLANGREVSQIMKSNLPATVRRFVISGDFVDTRGQFYLDLKTGLPTHWNMFRGDGTVLLQSSSDGNPKISFSSVAEHATIFDDVDVKSTLTRIFDENAFKIVKYGSLERASTRTRDGKEIAIDGVYLEINPPFAYAGSNVTLRVKLRGAANLDSIAVMASLQESGDASKDTPLKATRQTGELSDEIIYSFSAPKSLGVQSVRVMVPYFADLSDYFVTLAPRTKN